MKAIPKELRAYFPKVCHADRPWWLTRYRSAGEDGVIETFERPDGYETEALSDREQIDKDDPMPPPPILVGQVWALRVPGSPLYVGTITHTKQSHDLMVGLSGVGTSVLAEHLINDGYLLSCPYGYAPWSGPEVP